jgi:hypothetical protein
VTYKKEIPATLIALVLVWACLSRRVFPPQVRGMLFYVVLLFEVAMLVAAWWNCSKVRKSALVARWRKAVGWIATLANTLAFAIPVVFLVYIISYPTTSLRLHLPMIDGEKMIAASLLLCVFGFAAALVGPSSTRFPTLVGSVTVAMILVSIPFGVV